MIRKHIIGLAIAAVVAVGCFGLRSAEASDTSGFGPYNAGPVSTWSAYQPVDSLPAKIPQIDHTGAYNAYEQAYGN
jgi:hypothetical protein